MNNYNARSLNVVDFSEDFHDLSIFPNWSNDTEERVLNYGPRAVGSFHIT